MSSVKPIISFMIVSVILISCATSKKTMSNKASQMDEISAMMVGHFDSAAQASQDSTYYDISLVMHPIWTERDDAKWLYVEQAVSSAKKQPYRQRVYQLIQDSDGQIASRVYELPEPDQYIHAWEREEIFQELSPDQLILRTGCAVYMSRDADGCYSGATNKDDCGSTLRGARYATSKVQVCPHQLTSWDQGWDAADQQVWGATAGPYIFDKK